MKRINNDKIKTRVAEIIKPYLCVVCHDMYDKLATVIAKYVTDAVGEKKKQPDMVAMMSIDTYNQAKQEILDKLEGKK